MFTNTLITRKSILAIVMGVMMFFGVFTFAPQVNAQTTRMAQMLEQIQRLTLIVQQLQVQLAQLRSQGTVTPVVTTGAIAIGDKVQALDRLKVRVAPGLDGWPLGFVPAATVGEVVAGPTYAAGYTWWKVNYKSGTQGWSAANWLKVVSKAESDEMSEEEPEVVEDTYPAQDFDDVLTGEYGCLSSGSCLNQRGIDDLIEIDEDDVRATLITDDDGIVRGAVRFRYEFDVENNGEVALYIKKDSFLAMGSIGEKSDYMEDATDEISVDTDATGVAISGVQYYRIQPDERESFTVTHVYDPVVESLYMGTFYGFDFRYGTSKLYELDLYPDRLSSDFITVAGITYDAWKNGGDEPTPVEQMLWALIDQAEQTSVNDTNPSLAELFEQIVNLYDVLDEDDNDIEIEIAKIQARLAIYPEETGTYKGYLNGQLFIRTENISRHHAIENCELNARQNPSATIYCTWNGEAISESVPETFDVWSEGFTVDKNETGDEGVISFEFNIENIGDDDASFSIDDVDYAISGPNQSIVSASLSLLSGDADAEGAGEWTVRDGDEAVFVFDVVFVTAQEGDTGTYRLTIEEIAGVEVDETSSSLVLTKDSQSGEKVFVLGVYQAANAQHSFCESGWGGVDVNISNDLQGQDITLVLSSYEPVHWDINNQADANIQDIILSGYNPQYVSGDTAGVDITHYTFYEEDDYSAGSSGQGAFYDGTDSWPAKIYHWASQCASSDAIPVEDRRYLDGNSGYAYGYSSANNAALLSKVVTWTGQAADSFQGTYSGDIFTVSAGQVQGASVSAWELSLANALTALENVLDSIENK